MMTRGLRGSRGFRAARRHARVSSSVVAFGVAFIIICGAVCVSTSGVSASSTSGVRRRQKPTAEQRAKEERDARTLYRIVLSLDFARGYQGTERVRWTNRDDRPASVLYFHLYPNMRAED